MENLLLINTSEGKKFLLPTDKKILREAEYSKLFEASTLLENAQKEAASILEHAQAEFENQSKLGYEQGLIEGKLEMTEHMMDTLTKGVDYIENMELMVIDLVMASLARVLEGMNDKERVVAQVKSALNYTRNQKKVVLRVCPDEAEYVLQSLEEIQRGKTIDIIDVVSDSRLTKGACLLESELGLVDASVNIQLEGIRRSFEKRLNTQKN